MGAAELIPFEELGLDAEACGKIMGCSARTWLEQHACKPNAPVRICKKPGSWRAGDVIEYRDANRVGLRARRR